MRGRQLLLQLFKPPAKLIQRKRRKLWQTHVPHSGAAAQRIQPLAAARAARRMKEIHLHPLSVAALFLLLYGLWPGSIGSGDIKLALALVPGCPGWGAWTMAVTSFGLAALVALFYRFRTGKTIIPFGPFLLAGWWLAQEPFQRVWPGGWLW